ncbi:hypothetical protein P9112_014317 [Eukaryota sp. TZLM1-RC]
MLKLVAIFAFVAIALANDFHVINTVNSNPRALWVAGVNPRFAGMNDDERRALLGTRLDFINLPKKTEVSNDLPENFDVRSKWPGCPSYAIRDQGRCGSCWAFGAAEALSDRFCAAKGQQVILSPQYLVSCDKSNMACNGGWLDKVWNFMASTGVVEDSCMPYVSGQSGQVPACPTACKDGSELKMYKAANAYDVSSNEQAIMTEIEKYGSVEVGFSVYSDFMSYRSGIYHHVSGYLQGGHAVKLIGWGVENGEKYWLCANSWGASWGEKGHFRIRRGVNECNIESMVTAGQAGESPNTENGKCSVCKSTLKVIMQAADKADVMESAPLLDLSTLHVTWRCHALINGACSATDCIKQACKKMHFC